MIGLGTIRKWGVQGPPVMPIEKCVAHDGEICNMLCQKDGVAGCKHCMEQDHRSCGVSIPRSSRHIEAVNRQMKRASHPKDDSTDDIESQWNDPQLRHSSGGEVGKKPAKQSERSDDGQVPGRKHLVGQSQITDKANISKQTNKKSTTDDGQVPGIRSKHHEMYILKSCNVRIPSDTKTCDIFDLFSLPDGRLLMSDFNNRNIKLSDFNLNVSDNCDLPNIPSCICMMNDTTAVVAVGQSIQFLAITSKIKMIRCIKLGHSCEGLAYSAGEVYVSDGETNIHVYTVDGQKLRTMETCLRMNNSSESGFEWLTVSKDRSRLFLTNAGYGIVCLDILSGEVVWKINDTDGAGYSGLCVDRNNNVFVCSEFKKYIVQFSPNGQLSGVVLDGLRSARSIGIDDARGRLIVGLMDNDSIRVFDLKKIKHVGV